MNVCAVYAGFMPASFEVLRLKWPQDMNLHENDPQVILWFIVLTDVCHLFSWGSISLLILANGCSTVEKHTTRNVTPLSPKKLSTVIIGPWISFRTHLAFLSKNLRLSSGAPKKKHFSLDRYPKLSTKGWLSLVVNHPSRIWCFQRKYDGIILASGWSTANEYDIIWYRIP